MKPPNSWHPLNSGQNFQSQIWQSMLSYLQIADTSQYGTNLLRLAVVHYLEVSLYIKITQQNGPCCIYKLYNIIFIYKLWKYTSGQYFWKSSIWEIYNGRLFSWSFILIDTFETYQRKILPLPCNYFLVDQSKR